MALGCSPVIPDAQKGGYLKVEPPAGYRRGRICAITLGTARIEFQTDSFEHARELGLEGRFDLVAVGKKAAISLRSQSDVNVAVAVARAYMASRQR